MKILSEIKYAIQRITRGYSDRDIWNIDLWFEKTVIPMLKQLRKTKHGYPICFEEVEEWNNVMDTMIHYFQEMNPDTCSLKNEYEEAMYNLFEANYTESESIRKAITDKYTARQKEIDEYCEKNKNKAFNLFSKWFRSLWD